MIAMPSNEARNHAGEAGSHTRCVFDLERSDKRDSLGKITHCDDRLKRADTEGSGRIPFGVLTGKQIWLALFAPREEVKQKAQSRCALSWLIAVIAAQRVGSSVWIMLYCATNGFTARGDVSRTRG